MKATRQTVYASKIRRVLQLMIAMQSRPMHVHVIARELEVTERTAYRYLSMFEELGFKLNRTLHGAYTLPHVGALHPAPKRRARRINKGGEQ